jgi:general stress protein YciG
MSRIHLRGFASMDPARRRAIAAKGGKAVPAERRTFSIDRERAKAAGRKGGLMAGRRRWE